MPQGPGKHSHEQCGTRRPETGGYSFPSSFETDAVFISERHLLPFVGREQGPLWHCTAHLVPPKGEPGAPSSWQGRMDSEHAAPQAALPWETLTACQGEISKSAGCF